MGCLYNQLCETERYMITCGLRAGHSIRQIALSLQRSASSISRELRRNRSADNCYDAVLADKHAKERRYKPRREKKLDVHRGLRHYVVIKLDKYWSPQQIRGRLTKDFPSDKGMRISHETIYAYIYAMPKSVLSQSFWLFPYRLNSAICLPKNLQAGYHYDN